MTVSARLCSSTKASLTRFCKDKGITKTEAIERGIEMLLSKDKTDLHPAYAAYKQLKLVAEAPMPVRRSSDPMRNAIRAKYPG